MQSGERVTTNAPGKMKYKLALYRLPINEFLLLCLPPPRRVGEGGRMKTGHFAGSDNFEIRDDLFSNLESGWHSATLTRTPL